MAYMGSPGRGPGRHGRHAGDGLAIAVAFIGQAVLLGAIVVAAGVSHSGPAPEDGFASAAPSQDGIASAAPAPVITKASPSAAAPDAPRWVSVTADGSSAAGAFPAKDQYGDFTVTPGTNTSMMVTLASPDGAGLRTVVLSLAPGQWTPADISAMQPDPIFKTRASDGKTGFRAMWPVSDMQSGSTWTLILTEVTASGTTASPIATFTVAGS
jgi:hypothetical protein